MDAAQRKISRIKENLPTSNLKSDDTKFIAELVHYIGCINGRNKLQVSIHDSFNTRYKVIIAQMPEINIDDVRQVELMNSRIKSMQIDLVRGYLIIESWKIGKVGKTSKKKRGREIDEYVDLPNSFNLDKVDKNDIRQIEGILKLFLNATDLEFNVKLEQTETSYEVILSRLEIMDISKIDTVLSAYKAFVNQIYVDYPKKQLRVLVRKSDTPLESIAPYRRKLKVIKKD